MARRARRTAAPAGPVEGPWALPEGWRWERLEDVAPINPPRDFKGIPSNAELTFLPMAAVSELSGNLDLSTTRSVSALRSGFTRFRSGDVIFAKITPCMENGKLAVIPDLRFGMGAGSTEFHVLEPRQVGARYLFHWLSQEVFRNLAEHNMTGTAGQKRVPAEWLRNTAIPVPPDVGAEERVVARIDALFAEIDEGLGLLRRSGMSEKYTGLVSTLRQSILAAAFRGELVA